VVLVGLAARVLKDQPPAARGPTLPGLESKGKARGLENRVMRPVLLRLAAETHR
jgi:hypothetical protein